jgi:hypothetical protein
MMKMWKSLTTAWICCFMWAFLPAQDIEISPPQKTLVKFDDFEIVGRNSIGTVVHYYSKGNNHKLQVFNSKLRPVNEVDLDFDEKKAEIEKVLMNNDHILVFYSTIDDNKEYLKLKKINYRLDVNRDGTVLDSIMRGAVNSYQGYYIKPSRNDEHYVAFTYDEKNNRMKVHYVLMDKFLKPYKTGEIWTEDKSNMTLESVKVNNSGDLLVVIGHLNKRSTDEEDFSFDKFSIHYLPREDDKTILTEIDEEEYLYKDLLTNWDEELRSALVVGTYRKRKEEEDIGVFFTGIRTEGNKMIYTKVPFIEEDFAGSNAPFRRWKDNAEIQIPKRIIPRSDGGFIYVTEAEHHDYQLVSSIPGSTTGYPYYAEYTNYYDENYYYDLIAVSIDPDGQIDWRIHMPKIQETENDRGRYSSFMFGGNNNVVKLLFVDDIYGNGNLTEFNFNPDGQWNKRTLLNSYREDLLLVPGKGKQLSGREVILPSEKKNRLRLVKITF